MCDAFERKKPVERIRSSSSLRSAAASACGVGKRANSAGMTRLTRSSVHWADRMVATSSSKGLWCCSAHSSFAVPG